MIPENIINYKSKKINDGVDYSFVKKNNLYNEYLKYNPTKSELRYNKIMHMVLYLDYLRYTNDLALYEIIEEEYFSDINYLLKHESSYNMKVLDNILINHVYEEIMAGKVNKEHIDNLIYLLENYKPKSKYNFNLIINRADSLVKLYNAFITYGNETNNNYLLDKASSVKDIIFREYDINMKNLENMTNTRYDKRFYDSMMKKYKSIIKAIK